MSYSLTIPMPEEGLDAKAASVSTDRETFLREASGAMAEAIKGQSDDHQREATAKTLDSLVDELAYVLDTGRFGATARVTITGHAGAGLGAGLVHDHHHRGERAGGDAGLTSETANLIGPDPANPPGPTSPPAPPPPAPQEAPPT